MLLRMRPFRNWVRYQSTAPDKYTFYKLAAQVQRPAKDDETVIKTQSLTFDTLSRREAKDVDLDTIFGDGKKKALKSSRRDVSYRAISRLIAGVTVPKRPIEPDNCCMSGCINCVWELYGEDFEEWKAITKKAVKALESQGDNVRYKWPVGFDPPPDYLDPKYIPDELKQSTQQRRDVKNPEEAMPMGLSVFVNLEKKLKTKHSHDKPSTPDQYQRTT